MVAAVIKEQLQRKYRFSKKAKISWEEFVSLAKEAAKLYHFPSNIVICQAALESGRGTSHMAQTKNNYFGFMAYDEDPGQAKSYPTALDSILDYLELVTQNQRYAQVHHCRSSEDKLKAICEAGYATDPQYFQKITSLKEWLTD